jgi:hypothetical protein
VPPLRHAPVPPAGARSFVPGLSQATYVREDRRVSGVAFGALLSVLTGIAAVLLLQRWPTRYRWSRTISLTEGEETGRPIYMVRWGRRHLRWPSDPSPRPFDAGRRPKRGGPMDVSLTARIAVKGLGRQPNSEVVVDIPVHKPWRPVARGGVLTSLLPQYCDPQELRYFPAHIREKQAAGTLRLEDFLDLERSELRMYAFAYREHTGTRLMSRRFYDRSSIIPGVYARGEVVLSIDGTPPRRADPLVPHWVLAENSAAEVAEPRQRILIVRPRALEHRVGTKRAPEGVGRSRRHGGIPGVIDLRMQRLDLLALSRGRQVGSQSLIGRALMHVPPRTTPDQVGRRGRVAGRQRQSCAQPPRTHRTRRRPARPRRRPPAPERPHRVRPHPTPLHPDRPAAPR